MRRGFVRRRRASVEETDRDAALLDANAEEVHRARLEPHLFNADRRVAHDQIGVTQRETERHGLGSHASRDCGSDLRPEPSLGRRRRADRRASCFHCHPPAPLVAVPATQRASSVVVKLGRAFRRGPNLAFRSSTRRAWLTPRAPRVVQPWARPACRAARPRVARRRSARAAGVVGLGALHAVCPSGVRLKAAARSPRHC